MTAAVGLGIGVALTTLLGGSLRGLVDVRMRFQASIALLFVLQVFARGRFPLLSEWRGFSVVVWSATCVALLVLLHLNRHLPGIPLISLGLGLNTLVVLLNTGMPVLVPGDAPIEAASWDFYHLAGDADWPVLLADVLPLPGGWLVSLGDVVLVVGTIHLVVEAATSPSSRTITGDAA